MKLNRDSRTLEGKTLSLARTVTGSGLKSALRPPENRRYLRGSVRGRTSFSYPTFVHLTLSANTFFCWPFCMPWLELCVIDLSRPARIAYVIRSSYSPNALFLGSEVD